MATKTVYWTTDIRVCCGELPAVVHLETEDEQIISAVMHEAKPISDCDPVTYKYRFTYDDAALTDGSDDLIPEDIVGVACDGTWLRLVEKLNEQILALVSLDGWIPVTDEWTYLSSITVTVPAGTETSYPVGSKIKLVQSDTLKYFYVVNNSSSGVLQLNGGADYTLTNVEITSAHYSLQSNPVDFPQYFNYSPSTTGFSVDPQIEGRFSIFGKSCHAYFETIVAGTSNATTFTVGAPTTIGGNSIATGTGTDNGGYENDVLVNATAGQGSFSLDLDGGASSWTASGDKAARASIIYEIES